MSDDYPMAKCPKCGDEQLDFDGFGFIACIPGCGHCTHPSADGVDGRFYCGICGDDVTKESDLA
jgi:hypothetical protein